MEAVVFDMDGVIFDSERLVIECWMDMAEKYDLPKETIKKACSACTGTNKIASRKIFLDIMGEDFPFDQYDKERAALFHKKYGEGRLPVKKGVEELLSYLQSEGYKIALASSTREEIVKKELKDAGLLSYFEQVVCGDMVQRSKPYPDIFLEACKRLDVQPQKAYAIEDSYNGIRAAKTGELHPIMVPDLLKPTEEMERLADEILGNLLEVKKYLQTRKEKIA